jgi:hypothetical protein
VRIHSDKIEGGPTHQLRARDVRLILKAVPPEWVAELKEVRLANSLEHYRPYAFFNRYGGCLTVYSRTGTKSEVLLAVLSALAAGSLNIKTQLGRRFSEKDQRRLKQMAEPLIDEIMPVIAEPGGRGKWKVEI